MKNLDELSRAVHMIEWRVFDLNFNDSFESDDNEEIIHDVLRHVSQATTIIDLLLKEEKLRKDNKNLTRLYAEYEMVRDLIGSEE